MVALRIGFSLAILPESQCEIMTREKGSLASCMRKKTILIVVRWLVIVLVLVIIVLLLRSDSP